MGVAENAEEQTQKTAQKKRRSTYRKIVFFFYAVKNKPGNRLRTPKKGSNLERGQSKGKVMKRRLDKKTVFPRKGMITTVEVDAKWGN